MVRLQGRVRRVQPRVPPSELSCCGSFRPWSSASADGQLGGLAALCAVRHRAARRFALATPNWVRRAPFEVGPPRAGAAKREMGAQPTEASAPLENAEPEGDWGAPCSVPRLRV